jgi:hypothetical protein
MKHKDAIMLYDTVMKIPTKNIFQKTLEKQKIGILVCRMILA